MLQGKTTHAPEAIFKLLNFNNRFQILNLHTLNACVSLSLFISWFIRWRSAPYTSIFPLLYHGVVWEGGGLGRGWGNPNRIRKNAGGLSAYDQRRNHYAYAGPELKSTALVTRSSVAP